MNGSFTLRFKGETRQAAVASDGIVHVGPGPGAPAGVWDGAFRVAPSAHGAWRVTDPSGATRLVHVAASRGGHWVHVDGDVFWIEAGPAERPGEQPSGASGGLSAPMPATVLSIVAREGSHVAAGDVVLVLEAMKMELPVRAPHAGTIKAIRCSEGDLVQPGVPLAEIA
jgi:3-methylcrotonyl-CoA carboxylase alpha subunit